MREDNAYSEVPSGRLMKNSPSPPLGDWVRGRGWPITLTLTLALRRNSLDGKGSVSLPRGGRFTVPSPFEGEGWSLPRT
jgi:hypothetical protein